MVKDQAVGAVIDKKDKPAFLCLASKVRKEVAYAIRKGLPYKGELIGEFWNQCNRKRNDHIAVLLVGNRKIELEDAIVTQDLPTTEGLDQCIRLIMASSSAVWRYMDVGNGSGTPDITDTTLDNSLGGRADMSTSGTREPVGMTIRFLAVYGEAAAANPISECGVFSALTGGSMLNHNIFYENKLYKITNQQAAIISSIVEFCPRAGSF
jgi:hypothetical protein